MKIESKGTQTFNVPNTPEGREFLALARRYAQPGTRFTCRGRGSRKEHGDPSSLPIEHSDWIAVYVTNVNKEIQRKAFWRNQIERAERRGRVEAISKSIACVDDTRRALLDLLESKEWKMYFR